MASGQPALTSLPVVPAPLRAAAKNDGIPVSEGFQLRQVGCEDPRIVEAFDRFVDRTSRATGMVQKIEALSPAPTVTIACGGKGSAWPSLGEDESYRLDVGPAGVVLSVPEAAGALRGLATLFQLVAPGPNGFEIRGASVEDRPRFPWRGLLLDSSRHFLPVSVVKRTLDAMEVVKLNVLHWHLSDDQGFRVESRVFPRLHGAGSDGLFYTQEEVADVIEYARRRGIRVVPEFDVPGHATSWFVGYPELASEPGPYQIERRFGIFDPAMDPGREEVYAFLDRFVSEMAALFPDPYFHVGGDEVNGNAWARSASVGGFREKMGLPDSAAVQAHFSRRLLEILKGHRKKMIGWDDVLHADLARDVVVQSYRWHRKLVEAANRGNPSLLSSGYYLDLMFSAAWHYGVDPLGGEAAALPPEKQALVLGGEACMWTEFATAENVEAKIWPRAAAIAERLWSVASIVSVDDMYRRLSLVSEKLEAIGSTHLQARGSMIRRLTGVGPEARSLEILAEVVEPVKEYARVESGRYTSQTPLVRLVDLALPESDEARRFSSEVDAFVVAVRSGTGSAQAKAGGLREKLAGWRVNDTHLAPVLGRGGLLGEIRGVSENLTRSAQVAIEAIDLLVSGRAPSRAWIDRNLITLAEAARPKAEVILAVVPAIRRLVDAAAAFGDGKAQGAAGSTTSPFTKPETTSH